MSLRIRLKVDGRETGPESTVSCMTSNCWSTGLSCSPILKTIANVLRGYSAIFTQIERAKSLDAAGRKARGWVCRNAMRMSER